MNSSLRIGFLGAGKMASALAKGILKAGLVTPANVIASDIAEGARSAFAQATGAAVTANNQEVAQFAKILVLAVKPDQIAPLLSELRDKVTAEHLVVSIAAGVTLGRLESQLPAGVRVVRVMPNTPALVGASATGYALGAKATADDAKLVQQLFASVGLAFQVKEALLDAVTGLSGSGPAYIYQVIEALSDGGVAAGLPRDTATKLAAQTVLGAARMVIETGLHPGTLKDQVTSPGGTTIEGVHELEKAGVRAAFINAVRAASDKSRKLGQG